MADQDVTNIVKPEFWETEYLGDVPLPARPDSEMPFERCLAAALEDHAPAGGGERVLEVGCAPARWLVFYAERFGARVEGIEYTGRGVALSRTNLELCGISGEVRHGDFFELDPASFDLVLSLGFIEHFDDVERAFARHVEFVAPGGRLVVGVPNYRGVNRWLQSLADPDHLRLHNLRAMEPQLYTRLAARHGMRLTYLDHIGGFDPIIIKLGRRRALPFVILGSRYRRLKVADRLNHPLASSYLLVVMQRQRPGRAST
jgi:SAM-dependent methyltransferase